MLSLSLISSQSNHSYKTQTNQMSDNSVLPSVTDSMLHNLTYQTLKTIPNSAKDLYISSSTLVETKDISTTFDPMSSYISNSSNLHKPSSANFITDMSNTNTQYSSDGSHLFQSSDVNFMTYISSKSTKSNTQDNSFSTYFTFPSTNSLNIQSSINSVVTPSTNTKLQTSNILLTPSTQIHTSTNIKQLPTPTSNNKLESSNLLYKTVSEYSDTSALKTTNSANTDKTIDITDTDFSLLNSNSMKKLETSSILPQETSLLLSTLSSSVQDNKEVKLIIPNIHQKDEDKDKDNTITGLIIGISITGFIVSCLIITLLCLFRKYKQGETNLTLNDNLYGL